MSLFLYTGAITGAAFSPSWLLDVPLWFVAGLGGWGLHRIAHDCGHGPFSRSRRLNTAAGSFALLPLLYPYLMHPSAGDVPFLTSQYWTRNASRLLLTTDYAYPKVLLFPDPHHLRPHRAPRGPGDPVLQPPQGSARPEESPSGNGPGGAAEAQPSLADSAEPSPVRHGSGGSPSVTGELLGIPGADRMALRTAITATTTAFEPVFDPDELLPADAGMDVLVDCLDDLVRERRRRPGDDLVSAMVRDRDADGALREEELVASLVMFVIAGVQSPSET